jgi:hypothetical protein
MTSENQRAPCAVAIFALAEIKSAADAFDRGECNVCEALDAIVVAVDAYQAAIRPASRQDAA